MDKIRITEKETFDFDEIFFSLDSLKPLNAIFLYAERALGCITEKETFDLTRDFFVRRILFLDGNIPICREG